MTGPVAGPATPTGPTPGTATPTGPTPGMATPTGPTPGPTGPLLRMAGISKVYPDRTAALRPVDLSVERGEFVSVVGPSGCGKSTLLRIGCGLVTPTTGRAAVSTRRLGYVFQDPTLLPWRSVARNVGLLCELHGMPRHERRERVAEAIDRVGLAEFTRHRPRTLSGGMRMRVSLARTLTLRPELLLLDEPFGALDELTRERLGDELQALFVADRFGAVLVTHSVTEAVYLSSRVLVLSERPGRIVADVAVPFGYPRPPELRYEPEFAVLAARISADLRTAGRGSGTDRRPSPRPRGGGSS